ncbi:chemotaxis protein CheW [Sulfurimonas marina]|uniref:Chemotaxis protein CheW n=1 Tax=Sulfurimonas marina TaxID=2590551 RepID=A0A7M1AW02_9BACT|nr:chemotaxis protein CheW [Sulfurimonas marina]QOP41641.1 chemotaxis protein CheW [Sulfurimonas marina]
MKQVSYKYNNISKDVLPYIRHMEQVEDNRERLHELSNHWNTLSLLSQLGDAGVNMSRIKNNFTELSFELINHLAIELLNKNIDEMDFKAQVAVDIMIRNLFERTADIGFLATDDDIRAFLLKNDTKYSTHYNDDLEIIKERFKEYVKKYSVYFDIVLMSPKGEILANLDDELTLSKSKDSIIDEVLNTSGEYVETFKYHDFLPKEKKSLVYSYKVTKSNEEGSEIIGILSLCFKFQDEMKQIFSNLINKDKKEAILLLDHEGTVIATSDKYQIPLGAELEIVLNDNYKLISFGGVDYICKSNKTTGYQGFFGLEWYGHVMIPISHAFAQEDEESFEISEELLLSILQNGKQFSEALKNIPKQANSIQKSLNRAIWNGTINQGSTTSNKQFSKALMLEIRQTGQDTKSIIGSSIANLTKTIILGDSVFYADLIVDIMDRNLYERANDCRWWALTSDFQKILAKDSIGMDDVLRMNEILEYINDLYTVYTNIFIYDKHGYIKATSNPDERHLLGKRVSKNFVTQTLGLSDSSKYAVSDFEASEYYDNKHTYIYNAAIKNEENVVGGIGLVFDSEVQFKNMIQESLPKNVDGTTKNGVFATLATKNMQIISSTNEKHQIGQYLDIDSSYFNLQSGESTSEIIIYDDKYYALGVKCSKGYREYKSVQDDYVNDVYSFFFSYICDKSEAVYKKDDNFSPKTDVVFEKGSKSIDIATFMIANQWLGIDTKHVVETVSATELKTTIKIDKDHHFKGTVIYNEKAVMVIDIQKFLQEKDVEEYQEIVIIKYGEHDTYMGILVNSLGIIAEVADDNVNQLHNEIIGAGTLIDSLVFPSGDNPGKDVLSILSLDKIMTELISPEYSKLIHKQVMR